MPEWHGMTYEIMARECAECLTTPKRIVPAKRTAEILRTVRAQDGYFICHKSPAGREISCAGVIKALGCGQMHRIAGRLGIVTEIDPETRAAKRGA